MIYIRHDETATLDKLESGEITDLRGDAKWPADSIVLYALKEGFLQKGLRSFPDPRKNWSVPIDAILVSQILRSLNDEHSFLNAPYMLNNAELITKLGYNVKTLDEGFNDQNIYPRKAPFDGDTLKHILLSMKSGLMLDWFNKAWLSLWRDHAPGRTRYILDGMKIPIPSHLKDKFQECGCVSDKNGNLTYGYKAVFLYEIVDRKGVVVAMQVGPINEHDLVLGRSLIKEFAFEKEAMPIMDRGFIDGKWIRELKIQRQIDVCLPLRRNMEVVQAAVAQADNRQGWKDHPTRKNQEIYELKKSDLFWNECDVFATRYKVNGKRLLETYDQRAEIEEAHKQMKGFQGIEKLLSKNFANIVFRIVTSVIGYNLFNLFLNSEGCKDFAEYSLKTLRQRKAPDKNPKLIIYAEETYAVIRLLTFLPKILKFKKQIREKLSNLFESLDFAHLARDG